MPELPEVENFARTLNSHFKGKQIKKIIFHRSNLRYPFNKVELEKICSGGSSLLEFKRQGKFLVLVTNRGKIVISLGMTGRFFPAVLNKPELHEHVTLIFNTEEALGFADPRRFGFWKLESEIKQETAVDPLNSSELLNLFMSKKVRNLKRSVKDFLMDQKYIGGIGNIYAVEALYLASVNPTKLCQKIAESEWQNLARQIPQLLEKAIELGGSSVVSYRTFDGSKGSFQDHHKVYARTNEACLTPGCSGFIARITQGGRSSWYCPSCQK